jgi:superfamily II DNA/RNA helicase
VSTDLAARGLDIKDVKHVVHYQRALTAETFTHRNGRTARWDADGAVYLAYVNRSEPSVLFPLVKRDAPVAFCAPTYKSLHVNLEYALKNNVTIKGITESREFVSTAINLLANKAVNYSEFPYHSFKEADLPTLMEKYAQMIESGAPLPEQMDVVKFIF